MKKKKKKFAALIFTSSHNEVVVLGQSRLSWENFGHWAPVDGAANEPEEFAGQSSVLGAGTDSGQEDVVTVWLVVSLSRIHSSQPGPRQITSSTIQHVIQWNVEAFPLFVLNGNWCALAWYLSLAWVVSSIVCVCAQHSGQYFVFQKQTCMFQVDLFCILRSGLALLVLITTLNVPWTRQRTEPNQSQNQPNKQVFECVMHHYSVWE